MAPTDHAINTTEHKLGSISDLVIFQKNINFLNQALTNHGDDDKILDNGYLLMKYPENWAIFIRNDTKRK